MTGLDKFANLLAVEHELRISPVREENLTARDGC